MSVSMSPGVCVCIIVCVCVSSWPAAWHQSGEEQTFQGCISGLHGGGAGDGPPGRLPGGQREQSQHTWPQRPAGEGTPAHTAL